MAWPSRANSCKPFKGKLGNTKHDCTRAHLFVQCSHAEESILKVHLQWCHRRCARSLITGLLAMAKYWEPLQRSSVGEGLNKPWFLHMMEDCAAVEKGTKASVTWYGHRIQQK